MMKKEVFNLRDMVKCHCGEMATFVKVEVSERSHDLIYKCKNCKGIIKIELPIPVLSDKI